MTYTTLVENVRQLALPLQGSPIWEEGSVFSCINRTARRFAMLTKDKETSGTITLTSGTASYTISSALASDVDEISAIRIGDALVDILSLTDFERLTMTGQTTADSSTDTTFTGVKCKIYNGVITFYPSPDNTYTATVYYSKKESILTVSTTNLAAEVNLRDDYLNALMYFSAAEMFVIAGQHDLADKMEMRGKILLEEARDHQPMNEFDGQIQYSDPLS